MSPVLASGLDYVDLNFLGRPQIIATEVVRLPPMLKVRNFLQFSICRAPA